jgi:hypothetical protein
MFRVITLFLLLFVFICFENSYYVYAQSTVGAN